MCWSGARLSERQPESVDDIAVDAIVPHEYRQSSRMGLLHDLSFAPWQLDSGIQQLRRQRRELHVRLPNLMDPAYLAAHNGVVYNDSSVKIAAITDRPSNTFVFAERSKGHLFTTDPGYCISDAQWNSGRWFNTLVSASIRLIPGLATIPAFPLPNTPITVRECGEQASRRRESHFATGRCAHQEYH